MVQTPIKLQYTKWEIYSCLHTWVRVKCSPLCVKRAKWKWKGLCNTPHQKAQLVTCDNTLSIVWTQISLQTWFYGSFLWQLHRGLKKSIVHTYTHVCIKQMRNERRNICHKQIHFPLAWHYWQITLPRSFSDQIIHRIKEKMLPL